jgi:hypothetical protein
LPRSHSSDPMRDGPMPPALLKSLLFDTTTSVFRITIDAPVPARAVDSRLEVDEDRKWAPRDVGVSGAYVGRIPLPFRLTRWL